MHCCLPQMDPSGPPQKSIMTAQAVLTTAGRPGHVLGPYGRERLRLKIAGCMQVVWGLSDGFQVLRAWLFHDDSMSVVVPYFHVNVGFTTAVLMNL